MDVPNVSRQEYQLVSPAPLPEIAATPTDKTTKLDISHDGFLSLMNDDGDRKDYVYMPKGEIGEKINKLFKVDQRDTSELIPLAKCQRRISSF